MLEGGWVPAEGREGVAESVSLDLVSLGATEMSVGVRM